MSFIQSRQYSFESLIYNKDVYNILDEYFNLHCSLLRGLYNTIFNNELDKDTCNKLQREYILKYGIKARNFKSLIIEAKGLLLKQKTLIKLNKNTIESKIKKTKIKLKSKTLSKKQSIRLKGKLNRLNQKLQNTDNLKPAIFGSKKLYKQQFTNEKYINDHDLWLKEWREKRNGHVYLVGSSEETKGNSLCQLKDLENIQLTLPNSVINSLSLTDKHMNLDVKFYHENEKKNKRYLLLKEAIDQKKPIMYIIIKKNDKYYVQASFDISVATKQTYGTLGVDFNYNLISCSEIKHDGNPINFYSYDYNAELSSEQIEQRLSVIAASVVDKAEKLKFSVTLEDLNLEEKKRECLIKQINKKINTMPYIKFKALLYSKCLRKGVKLIVVNPAFTSISAAYKYCKKYGRTVHECAALCIGRRGLKFKEKIPTILYSFLHSGERKKHHWSQWGFINREMKSFLKGNSLYNTRGYFGELTTISLSHPVRSGGDVDCSNGNFSQRSHNFRAEVKGATHNNVDNISSGCMI